MPEQVLKDRHGYTIGCIATDSRGVQTIKDKHGYMKGTYDPKSNTTKDSHGYKIGSGNLLTTLL